MKRTAEELTKIDRPFFATIFTLSSHHPYDIPKKYEGKFAEGTLPIHKSILYADYSLKEFFKQASTLPWFKNTLFVITADHTATSDSPYYQNRQGMYSIPLLFFMPSDNLLGKSNKTCQQIDILPSIMSYLNYDYTYFAFGQNTFDKNKTGYAITYLNDTYQYIESNYTFITDYTGKNEYYQFADDTIKDQLAPDSSQMHLKLNAFIQNYNSALINNKMIVR
ncbi:MAG: sulfatase-like hydrolase/transferase [Bacteroidetes bacterium]|nr:sulfatase-like hydrolase/transferase [Bacteroidota bacterium]